MPNPLSLIIKTFQSELLDKYNIKVKIWGTNGQGKALGGAKDLLATCGDVEMACAVVRRWLSSKWERQNACHLYRCAQVATEHMIAIQEANQQPDYAWVRTEQPRVTGWESRNVRSE